MRFKHKVAFTVLKTVNIIIIIFIRLFKELCSMDLDQL